MIYPKIEEVKKIVNVSPQETSVAPKLTVKENLEFIAGIYGAEAAGSGLLRHRLQQL